jgi:hypothetical protein
MAKAQLLTVRWNELLGILIMLHKNQVADFKAQIF